MILAFIGGLFLGTVFFLGLYYTTRKVSQVKNPALFMIASALLRMTILLFGLYFISLGRLSNLLIAISGVLLAKYLIVNRVKKGGDFK